MGYTPVVAQMNVTGAFGFATLPALLGVLGVVFLGPCKRRAMPWQDKAAEAMKAGAWDKAVRCLSRAVLTTVGAELANAHRLMGVCHTARTRLAEAMASFEESARVAEACGDKVGTARALGNVGLIWQRRGRYNEALACYEQALELFRQLGDRLGEATACVNLGPLLLAVGQPELALDMLSRALEFFLESGARREEAGVRANIGMVHAAQGQVDVSLEYWSQALDIARQIGDKRLEASVLGSIASASIERGESARARVVFEEILKLHDELGDPDGSARDRVGIGQSLATSGEYEQAVRYLARALADFLKLDVADGPRQCLLWLPQCLQGLGRDRFLAACVAAGLTSRTAATLVDILERRRAY